MCIRDRDKLDWVKELKLERRGRISEYAEEFGCEFLEEERPWGIEAEIALPCATENELEADDAQKLLDGPYVAVVEGSNMPLSTDANRLLREEGFLIGPAKAANAGGVAVSGFEQSQNAARLQISGDDVDRLLRETMEEIHHECVERGERDDGSVDYVRGANRAGFARVSEAMIAQGAV